MMKLYYKYSILGLMAIMLFSCEDPYTPPTREDAQQYVIEGFVEAGDEANATYVIVTKSVPFLEEIGPEKLASLFVKDAVVTVNDGAKTVELNRVCTSNLPEEIRRQVLQSFGLNPDSTVLDICLYIDLLDRIDRREGGKYDLKVTIGDKIMTATTTIPKKIAPSGFRWSDPPGTPNDTMARLWVMLKDPVGKNYFRYMTSDSRKDVLVTPPTSVFDDAVFDGKEFEFPLNKAEEFNSDTTSTNDFDTFGLYMRGDTFSIKWMTIDQEHFDFWNTRDASANRQGPFASYIRIKSNIKGGLGIWGGYYINRYELFCPPK